MVLQEGLSVLGAIIQNADKHLRFMIFQEDLSWPIVLCAQGTVI